MRLYDRYILPKLIDSACSGSPTRKQRAKIIPLARGNVLEVGIGTGKNLPYYDPEKVRQLWAIDPSPELLAMAADAVHQVHFPVDPSKRAAKKSHSRTTAAIQSSRPIRFVRFRSLMLPFRRLPGC